MMGLEPAPRSLEDMHADETIDAEHSVICEACEKPIVGEEIHRDESGDYHVPCIEAWAKQSALDAGIPLSVIEGKTKLSDHFSEDYINAQCGQVKIKRCE
jgi:hypothetical protein